jgi:hypothetical protein
VPSAEIYRPQSLVILPPRENLPSGEERRVAKTKRSAPQIRARPRGFVEKIHRLRLHIVQPDVELLSLPTRPTGTSQLKSRELRARSTEYDNYSKLRAPRSVLPADTRPIRV